MIFHKLSVSLSLLAIVTGAGCGGATVTEDKRTPPAAEAGATATTKVAAPRRSKGPKNPAQQPDPSVSAHCNEVPLGHACRASTAAPEDPNESPQRNCDTNIVANANTSCGFAENAFYEYYKAHPANGKGVSITVHSPSTSKDYELGCEISKGLIGCISSPTSKGIYISFPEAAIDEYTETQAEAYASTHDVGHPGKPAAIGHATEPESNNESSPSSTEDEVGSYGHGGDTAFCQKHTCIGEFESEDGYVAQCADGTYSHSGGKSGACSAHGGERHG
jgi:hypothetical protein